MINKILMHFIVICYCLKKRPLLEYFVFFTIQNQLLKCTSFRIGNERIPFTKKIGIFGPLNKEIIISHNRVKPFLSLSIKEFF